MLKRKLLFLWLFCIFGSLSILPYVRHLGILPSALSIAKMLIVGVLQSSILFGFICWAIFKILPKTDLQPFHVQSISNQIVYPGIIAGGLVGLVIFCLDRFLFQGSLLAQGNPPYWISILYSIYGAINEEVLLRLFFFTLLYFVLTKIFKPADKVKIYLLWTANLFTAILFGVGHLPFLFSVTSSPSFSEISEVLILNGLGGVVFGWLYWSRGLWAAVVAHFVADLVLHVRIYQ